MNEHELIREWLKKLISDLTYYEFISGWSPENNSVKIHDLNVAIKATCDSMNLIGKNKFWFDERGVKSWDGKWVDVYQRYGLFRDNIR